MDENNNKKQRRLFIIGAVVLLIMLISAAYAYFAVITVNNFGTSTINAQAGGIGSVTLNGTNAILTMNLDAIDMVQGNNNVTYYASSSGKTTTPTTVTLGTASVSPNTDTNYYHCTYTLSVTHTGTNDMYNLFNHQTNNTYDYTNRSEGQIILTINGFSYDFYESNYVWSDDYGYGWPANNQVTGEFYIKGNQTKDITASLRIVNRSDVDQSYLASSDIAINISLVNGSFNCTPEDERTITYWTNTEGFEGSHPTSYYYNAFKQSYENLEYFGFIPRYYVKETSTPAYAQYDHYVGSTYVDGVLENYEYYYQYYDGYSTQYDIDQCNSHESSLTDNGVLYENFCEKVSTAGEDLYEMVYHDVDSGEITGTSSSNGGEFIFFYGGLQECENNATLYNNNEETFATCEPYRNREYELCIYANNTLICNSTNDYSGNTIDMDTLKTQYTNAGLICKYFDIEGYEWTNSKPESGGRLECGETDPSLESYNSGDLYVKADEYGVYEVGEYSSSCTHQYGGSYCMW